MTIEPWREFQIAETERLTAERLLQETQDLLGETRQRLRQDATEEKERFRQRVGDIDFWKSELEKKLSELKEAIEAGESEAGRVNHALAGTICSSSTVKSALLIPSCWLHLEQEHAMR